MLKISAITPNSFIDYPKRISRVIFTQGCNLVCPYCHNSALLDRKKNDGFDIEVIINYLKNGISKVNSVVITGGEPTLHGDSLVDFLKQLKYIGYSIKLDTNGTRPDVVEKCLGIVDYIAMDFKTAPLNYVNFAKKDEDKDTLTSRIISSVDQIKNSSVDYEFRITCDQNMFNSEDFETMYSILNGSKKVFFQKVNKKNSLLPEKVNPYSYEEIKKMSAMLSKVVKYCEIR